MTGDRVPEELCLEDVAHRAPDGHLLNPATAVSVDGRGLLILGGSGRGKSTLAWSMLGQGASLIADDAVLVRVSNGTPMLTAPPTLPRWIEARGIGLLSAPELVDAALGAVVTLDWSEPDRLPPRRRFLVAGHAFPLILGQGIPSLGMKLVHFLTHGRADDPNPTV